MKNIQSLKNNNFFSGISEADINEIFNLKEFTEIKEGDIIYKTGEESLGLYLVIKGDVRIKYSSNNYISNKIFNDFFGEKELIDNTRRISSAVAFSKLLLYRIDRNIFKNLLAKNPVISGNVKKYGELKLPEINYEIERTLKLAETRKPVSFKAFPETEIGNADKDKKKSSEIEDTGNNNHQLPDELKNLSPQINQQSPEKEISGKINEKLKEELLDDPEDFKNWQFTETSGQPNQVSSEVKENKDTSGKSKETVPAKEKEKIEDKGFDRETLRKVLASIRIMYTGLTLAETIKSIITSLRLLTACETGSVILVDEKRSEMKKIEQDSKPHKIINFQMNEGLTGACSLQKKVLNFERPTEDSRFNSDIDQPGPARLKRIIYFPVVNETGETVAVVQLANENKKFTEPDIANITMLSTQIENALDKSIKADNLLTNEKRNSVRKIKDFILNEIKSPVNVINNYSDILNTKNLSEDINEIIRMLQKQANSVEDLADTLFNCITEDIKLIYINVHFNELIHDILELLSEYCESRGIKLYKKIGNGAVVNIDRGKFYTAVYQVIRVCCNDSNKEGKIFFSTELHEDNIAISIKVEGKGHIEEVNGNIIEMINNDIPVDTDKLVLIIAKKLITLHSGQMHYESVKGTGTTFTILFPAVKEQAHS